jgi:hypothetical protein
VRTITGTSPEVPTIPGPPAGAEPRNIVFGFLQASVQPDARHSAARQYLTPDAGTRWQDSTVQILDDYKVDVPTIQGSVASVDVSGDPVGQLNESGEFTPETSGNGVGHQKTFSFKLRKIDGQWRIDKPPAGVLIRQVDFAVHYTARPLYFYDSEERQLVPDIRYTSLNDQALAEWLMSQLLAGPRPELAQSVQSEIPDQTDPRRVDVTMGDVISVEVPGSSQLDAGAKIRLATELAYTFSPVRFSSRMTLTDSGRPVAIPAVGTVFSTLDFPSEGIDRVTPASPYFLRSGGLINGSNGRPVAGPVGSGGYSLTSVAVQQGPGESARVAGLNGTGLEIGDIGGPLLHINLPRGQVSRPVWEPGQAAVWVGVGGSLFRVISNHEVQAVSMPAPLSNGLQKGQIEAISFSPDGVRVALVLQSAETSAVWVGSVAKGTTSESVGDFEAITPSALNVSDVAWTDPTSLILVGASAASDKQILSVQSDGSFLQSVSQTGLPRNLQNVAAFAGASPMVWTADPATVWIQDNGSWRSLIPPELTTGYAPTYATS